MTNEIALSLRIYDTFACYLVHLSLRVGSRIVGWWSSGGGVVVARARSLKQKAEGGHRLDPGGTEYRDY